MSFPIHLHPTSSLLQSLLSAMEASLTRSLLQPTNRHFLTTTLLLRSKPLSLSNPNSHRPSHSPNFKPYTSTQSHPTPNPPKPINPFARILSSNKHNSFEWKFPLNCRNSGELGLFPDDKRPIVTVVLLGWLGSKQKHLRRYAEMYNAFGMNAVMFAASVNDVIGFDLGRKLETRIASLTDALVAWLEEKESDGKERFLIFHTFSNTGWLAYGSILNILQGREELLEKIKGCVADSAGDPELDPKVWAAGFATAILKKRSSAVNSSSEDENVQNAASNAKEPLFTEVLLLTFFEKFFKYFLELPDIKKRFTKTVTTLSENQPCYPQIYLYSTADKVIPFHKIESFAEHQKKLGRQVTTFNFESTPHVDHYRTFPDTYRSLIEKFLKDCFAVRSCTA